MVDRPSRRVPPGARSPQERPGDQHDRRPEAPPSPHPGADAASGLRRPPTGPTFWFGPTPADHPRNGHTPAGPTPANGTPSRPADGPPQPPTNAAPFRPADGARPHPTAAAPSQPADTASPRPADAPSFQPADGIHYRPAAAQPADGTSHLPADAASFQPADGIRYRPADAAQPLDGAANLPADAAPHHPADAAPHRSAAAAPHQPSDSARFQPVDAAPFHPADAARPRPAAPAPHFPADAATPFPPAPNGSHPKTPPSSFFTPISQAPSASPFFTPATHDSGPATTPSGFFPPVDPPPDRTPSAFFAPVEPHHTPSGHPSSTFAPVTPDDHPPGARPPAASRPDLTPVDPEDPQPHHPGPRRAPTPSSFFAPVEPNHRTPAGPPSSPFAPVEPASSPSASSRPDLPPSEPDRPARAASSDFFAPADPAQPPGARTPTNSRSDFFTPVEPTPLPTPPTQGPTLSHADPHPSPPDQDDQPNWPTESPSLRFPPLADPDAETTAVLPPTPRPEPADPTTYTPRRAAPDPEPDEDQPKHGKHRKHKKQPLWRELVTLVAVALLLTFLIQHFVGRVYSIPSGSMEQTLHGCPGCTGDRVFVDKMIYDFRDPLPGDVVVFQGPNSWTGEEVDAIGDEDNPIVRGLQYLGSLIGIAPPDERDFVKRVVAIGGQTVECCDDEMRVLVDGKPLDEPYIYWEGGGPDERQRFAPVTVPEGTLWVMGDNRANSADSRIQGGGGIRGVVPITKVIGKVRAIVLPPSRWQGVGDHNPQASPAIAAPAWQQGLPAGLGFAAAWPLLWLGRRVKKSLTSRKAD